MSILTDDQILDATKAAIAVVTNPGAWSAATVAIANALLHYRGAGTTLEQNARLKEWAEGADRRVGDAHEALVRAGVGARAIIDAETKTLEIATRIGILARQRDEAIARVAELAADIASGAIVEFERVRNLKANERGDV